MKMKWFDVAKIRMKESGITQETLAEHLGITKGAVSHWLNDRRKPDIEEIAKIMDILGMTEFVVNPDGTISEKDGVTRSVSYVGKKEVKGSYPLISWVSAGCWLEAVEPYRKDDIDIWPETTVDASDSSFWLRVRGDSMTSPNGFTVPEGMIILVDPEKEAISGKLVVAKLENENEATFKQYMTDAGRKYLKALNPHHPPTIINGNCKIIGVVVDIKWEHIP